MELKICHLYPDILNLYGDRGNIICLEKRARWRGLDVSTTGVSVGETADFTAFDLFFIGGGQDFEQAVLLQDLAAGKGKEIKAAAHDGKVFLAICGGYQILGTSYRTWDGDQFDFIGALDIHTVGSRERMIGNFIYRCPPENSGARVVGFENHSGKTYLGPDVSPLGTVLKGHGNNGEDGSEGARSKNIFATYSHGPLLPKNPVLADFILQTAIRQKDPGFVPEPLDDLYEKLANDSMAERLLI